MKLAVVTPRYGDEIPGGAETAARLLATRLATRPGFDVVVLTTCALDANTWENHYPAGATEIGGVRVHRFAVTRRRAADFDASTDLVVRRGSRVSDAQQQAWIEEQGPVAPGLIDAISQCDADAIAFHPFLYHPTVAGLPRVADRAILHPAAHDEPMLRLPLFRSVFGAAAGLAYWSDPERHLVEQRFAVASKPAVVVGLGVDPRAGSAHAARSELGLDDDRPYLLCLGRVDDGKGARLLAECFAHYKRRRAGPLRLIFAGPVANQPPAHRDITTLGPVSDEAKWGLLRGARALVSPSAFESFSIVLMEAWSVGTPALVNSRCAVTVDHARRSGGALAFAGYAELEVELDRLNGSPALRDELGRAGRSYVESHYTWDDVIERYARFVQRVGSHRVRTPD
jgi:glycosyltransferase involved in cell wall biosynthesis